MTTVAHMVSTGLASKLDGITSSRNKVVTTGSVKPYAKGLQASALRKPDWGQLLNRGNETAFSDVAFIAGRIAYFSNS